MSWSVRLAPLIVVSACGGTVTNVDYNGTGGVHVGTGGAQETGGDDSGGSSSGGTTHSTGGVGSGGKGAGGAGAVGTGGRGVMREPAKHRPNEVSCLAPIPAPFPNTGGSSNDLIPPNTGGTSSKTLPIPATGGTSGGIAPPPTGGSAGVPIPNPGMCTVDTDCTTGANGRCILGRAGRYCTYDACFKDADCGTRTVCMCGTPGGTGAHCGQPGCHIDADCPGSWCSPTFSSCGNYSGVIGYACHTPADECVDDSDCSVIGGASGYCMYMPTVAHWVCSTSQCAG